ncbi:hypothetical protein [Dysosmobacter sp.]|uniref:hypothetical protein n=1 Tax=Dysosmobacter sp. TaxID=2591382 RepID=UPI002A979280|nr:hypothetical protein [Dysosmobacter sp.]MDY5509307.1 hypothetical protein [Dysosmobacter sp.]
MSERNALDIARHMAELGQREDACRAYTLVLSGVPEPEEELEAALYLLQFGDEYQVAYTAFIDLYQRGFYQEELLSVMTQAFYEPNVKLLKSRYEKNCKALSKYPYLFRKDFPAFEELPIRFYPYDDRGYLPFDRREGRFGPYVDFNHPVVSRNYFLDLEQPVLAADVFSQYELEYLNDNVRKSEWVGRENHIYLHYTDWTVFCAYLQVINLRALLPEKKIVFLIEGEIAQYPIDFKERFGLDYSQYPVKPVGIREVSRLIWHTQLATHNGGDFFNEIFDGHPNLAPLPSVMFSRIQEALETLRQSCRTHSLKLDGFTPGDGDSEKAERLLRELWTMHNPTEKDLLVTLFLCFADLRSLDPAARIVPAIFFQPHFHHINYTLSCSEKGWAVLDSEEYRGIRESPMFREFKYIKTFTPMRRMTTSTASTVHFMCEQLREGWEKGEYLKIPDALAQRVLNRSYMIDWQDRLYQDSVLVRFEDGKLNPRATFTALAAFLDLPYTQSMTYCSLNGQRDPESLKGNDLGFSTAAITRTYDDFLGTPERYFLEYFCRDAYEYYGYDFQYYDGAPVDMEKARDLVDHMDVLDGYIAEGLRRILLAQNNPAPGEPIEDIIRKHLDTLRENRLQIAGQLLRGLYFVNKKGQPLHMMPRLELDPALLEQPLYH